MYRLASIAFLLSCVLSFSVGGLACQQETAKPSKETAKPSKTKAPGASTQVHAPTASDLTRYTEGLEGSGMLMVRFNTNQGTIHCELLEKEAPMTVANFVGLARGLHPFTNPVNHKTETRPYYDGLIFHRVIPNFMIQGGDPIGNGKGGPGYKFAQEISPNLRHDKPGVLSMANAGPNTNGSQFFITEAPRPSLDGGYNIFGQCEDIDIVKKIARVQKRGSKPIADVVMEKVEIYRK